MKYFVRLVGRELVVEVDGDRVTVDGREAVAHLSAMAGTPLRNLVLDGRSYTLPLAPAGRGRWQVGRGGESWEAEVVDERTRHIQNLTGQAGAARGPGALRAPMPGLVVRVEVTPGQPVSPGQGAIVLEAMKMQNELRVASPGMVRAVRVVAGQAVEKGQVLVEFDDEHPGSGSGE